MNRKILVIPNNLEERNKILGEFIDRDNIPTWLGGKSTYTFDATQYYMKPNGSDKEAVEYLVTMPYHAA